MERNTKLLMLQRLMGIFLVGTLVLGAFPLTEAAAQTRPPSVQEGEQIFRFDTFGSEAFWGGQLRLHRAIAGAANGGVGPGLTPTAALNLGLKVDSAALPAAVIAQIRGGTLNLNSPRTTLQLLQLDAVVGVKGIFNAAGALTSVGIRCALCHTEVDDSVAPGIGRRLDGWANRDLDIGKIIALAPNLQVLATFLSTPAAPVTVANVRTILNAWGPGRFDAALILDGQGFRPDGQTAAVLIPPAFGLAGVSQHTWVGWGGVPHWNAYVATSAMMGSGRFFDPRLNDPVKFPVAVKNRLFDVRERPDLVTSKMASLHLYQMSLEAPRPPRRSFNAAAATRGRAIFNGKARCAVCHPAPLYTEPGWNMHTPDELGVDPFHAQRSPDGRYRTPPLKGLWTHLKGGLLHDGSARTLRQLVSILNTGLALGLTPAEQADLVQFLRSL